MWGNLMNTNDFQAGDIVRLKECAPPCRTWREGVDSFMLPVGLLLTVQTSYIVNHHIYVRNPLDVSTLPVLLINKDYLELVKEEIYPCYCPRAYLQW